MLECGALTVLNRRMIRINEQDGSLLALIIPTMPTSIRKHLLDNFMTVFPGKLKTTDTQAEGEGYFFECLHLSWYNRYSTKVRTY